MWMLGLAVDPMPALWRCGLGVTDCRWPLSFAFFFSWAADFSACQEREMTL
jgi:hypothetical protein